MPVYEYACEKCGHAHDEFQPIAAQPLTKCPRCGAKKGYGRKFSVPNAIVRGVESARTFGQAAEENARRLGKAGMDAEVAADKARVSNYKGKLPKGAEVNTTGTGATPPWRDGSMGAGKLDKPLDVAKLKNPKRYIETGKAD